MSKRRYDCNSLLAVLCIVAQSQTFSYIHSMSIRTRLIIYYSCHGIALLWCILFGGWLYLTIPFLLGGYIRSRGYPKLPSINNGRPFQFVIMAFLIPAFLVALCKGWIWLQAALLMANAANDLFTDVTWLKKLKQTARPDASS